MASNPVHESQVSMAREASARPLRSPNGMVRTDTDSRTTKAAAAHGEPRSGAMRQPT